VNVWLVAAICAVVLTGSVWLVCAGLAKLIDLLSRP